MVPSLIYHTILWIRDYPSLFLMWIKVEQRLSFSHLAANQPMKYAAKLPAASTCTFLPHVQAAMILTYLILLGLSLSGLITHPTLVDSYLYITLSPGKMITEPSGDIYHLRLKDVNCHTMN